MPEILKDWWPLIAAAIAGVFGFRSGQDKNRWRIEAAERRISNIEKDVETLKESRSLDATTLAVIQSTLTQIKDLIGELRSEIKQKADK